MSGTDRILQRLLKLHPNKLIDLKLDRVERLLEVLGRPQDGLPPVIHVAGTNGKGSTIAHLRAFLEAAGKRVHVYTSPHLVRFNERIRLAGDLVSDQQLNSALELCEEKNKHLPITYFEITTAAAFYLFSTVPADYLLLEVGLGGRFDATNVIDRPLGSIITPVSIDHTEFLGSDLGGIAREKAGVLKANTPAAIGLQTNIARAAIEDEAQKLEIAPKFAGQDFDGFEQYGRLVYQDETGLLDLPLSNLAGPFQTQNAALAIAAVRYFNLPVTDAEIAKGLREVNWPGRLTRITGGALYDMLPKDQELWLDGGHNVAGGKVLAQALGTMSNQTARPLVLVLGTYANKDAKGYLAAFEGLVEQIITVPIQGERAAWSAKDLAELARESGMTAQAQDGFQAALETASSVPHARVVVCGSLHLAGQFLEQNKTPPV